MIITILGCGTSSGVPALGCECAVCRSNDPKNQRRRVSILVEQGKTRLLVDTSPDLRAQLLDAQITHLDGVLYTHAHADHLHGIDDLRSVNFNMDRAIDVWGSQATLDIIQDRFGYAFRPIGGWWSRPSLNPHVLTHGMTTEIGDVSILPFDQIHGRSITSGFRFGDAAYSTDVKEMPERTIDILQGIKLWIVDCVGFHEHPTHAHLDLALDWIAQVNPERAVLTHMSHQFDYEILRARLPKGVEPGYDGMSLEL
ncbi:MAG: MBL fold metallo-hydrolase [Alphaproteobacteria bacterium]